LDPDDLTDHERADLLDPWEEIADPLDESAYTQRTMRSRAHSPSFRSDNAAERAHTGCSHTRRLVLTR
jgi:hypothetical protein